MPFLQHLHRHPMAACSHLNPTNAALSSSVCKRRRSSARRSLASDFLSQHAIRAAEPSSADTWKSLGTERSELSLSLTLPTGQSFRWKQTGNAEYTGVIDRFLFTLREGPKWIEYVVHNRETKFKEEEAAAEAEDVPTGNCTKYLVHNQEEKLKVEIKDEEEAEDVARGNRIEYLSLHQEEKIEEKINDKEAEEVLRDYFNLKISLQDVWTPFINADQRFAALAPHLAGARLLRQSPLECLFQFICSSNNHIQRISHMVDYLASRGPYLGTVKGMPFHAFPSLSMLAEVTETELRAAGFGYRAKYIVGAVKELQAKEGGGEEWLCSLRLRGLDEALDELCSLPGVGPKVAACIALFSLDQHHAIPVDTHVWRIATTYIMPELAGARLTSKFHSAVSKAFVNKFGKYAGWAQNVLFIAELSSHQFLLPEDLRTSREKKSKAMSNRKIKIAEG